MNSPHDTIAAVATPLGEGGLGVIRVSGAKSISIVQRIFSSSKIRDLSQAPTQTCYFGTIKVEYPSPPLASAKASAGRPSPTRGEGDLEEQPLPPKGGRPGLPQSPIAPQSRVDAGGRPPLGPGEGGAVDQVVVTLFRAPHSYTGEDVIEISAHGSPFTLRKILNLCLAQGARLAGPGEFTERAFLNGKMDLTQAEAVAELIRAKTDKSQAAALSQLQGSLSEKVRGLRDILLPLLAHIEVGLDHSDEDHDFLPSEKLAHRCLEAHHEIEEVLASERVSKILREGFRVALLGRPNVGKSSLLNALLKEDRAIVTPIPGTTRDTLEESLNLKGIPVTLTDTAGMNNAAIDPVEQLGIGRTRMALEQADAVLAVLDGSEPFTTEDDEVMKACLSKPHVFVINKCDLCASKHPFSPRRVGEGLSAEALAEADEDEGGNLAVQTAPLTRALPNNLGSRSKLGHRSRDASDRWSHPPGGEGHVVHVSAKTGEGLEILAETISELALHEKAHGAEAQWLLNARHQAALSRAKEALAHAAQSSQEAAYEECVALDLQTAVSALGEVIGETTTEELLDEIFSTFCIGK